MTSSDVIRDCDFFDFWPGLSVARSAFGGIECACVLLRAPVAGGNYRKPTIATAAKSNEVGGTLPGTTIYYHIIEHISFFSECAVNQELG